MINLLQLNSTLNLNELSAEFARNGRVQVRDVLETHSAEALQQVLAQHTSWGAAWSAGNDGPHRLTKSQLSQIDQPTKHTIAASIEKAMRSHDFAFTFAQYPILDAYLAKWMPGSPYDVLLEHINAPPFLNFVREITGIQELRKADAQATLFGPGQFLAQHDDSHVAEGWRVAYVLSLAPAFWRPDWGGYLMFYDEDGDVVSGFKPRFNALNLFAVPSSHAVSYVTPFAPAARYSVTGWLRDR